MTAWAVRTLMRNLRQEGFEIGHEHTRRLMKALNLKVKQKPKYKVTSESQKYQEMGTKNGYRKKTG